MVPLHDTRLVMKAPAKVNLVLCVGARRPDQYHDLVSIFQAVDVQDDVVLDDEPAGSAIVVTTSDPDLPTDDRNTAYRAALLLREAHAPGRAARIHLEKRIPAEAGLGGGSSDAAAVLLGLNRLWNLGLSYQALLPLASTVGSDVPFFLTGGCALVRGRGERVQPLPHPAPGWLVLAKPAFGVSTARAYADLAAMRAGAPPPECEPAAQVMRAALERDDLPAVAGALRNDLEAPVLAAHPEIARLKEALLAAGALGALLCGSGSTLFGLFTSVAAAETAAGQLAGECAWVRVAAPLAAGQARGV
ncbi:MAG: 4-(cytidine 5'-diphospho)-2-C-methyl-D-erythritol kinase [Armatimonadetes bacterium]|jgi:4-diphosphocytidyl-2-C-methyl-D-erythritol kinase|nr:4-(cytidine 5'-diphospho)-2-C-methyl-D-erythritol kinase [Armatimonadota bacterium]